MPFKNKELLSAWQIKFIDYIEHPRGGWAVMIRFEVIFPDGNEISVRPIFTMEFVEDYFCIPGDQNIDKNRSRIIKEKEDLFQKWCIVRIEECINNDSLEEEPTITGKDFAWAKKVEKGLLQPSSEAQNDNIYIYLPERRIGFR